MKKSYHSMAVPIKLAPRTCLMEDVRTAFSLPELSNPYLLERQRAIPFPSGTIVEVAVSCCSGLQAKTSRRDGGFLLNFVLCVQAIGYEHVAGAVRDHQGRRHLHRHRLRCDPAGPEDRYLVLVYRDGLPKLRLLEVSYAQGLRVPYMHRRAVHRRVPTRDRYREGNLVWTVGPHAHDHRPGERPRRDALPSRDVHGNVLALIQVCEAQSRVEQSFLEGEAAADQERHQIVLPVRRYLRRLVDALAVLVHPIFRNVGPQIRIGSHHRRSGGAHVRDLQNRTGFWVPDTELQEVEGVFLRQYYEVRLHVPARDATGRPGVFAATDACSRFFLCQTFRVKLLFHHHQPSLQPLRASVDLYEL